MNDVLTFQIVQSCDIGLAVRGGALQVTQERVKVIRVSHLYTSSRSCVETFHRVVGARRIVAHRHPCRADGRFVDPLQAFDVATLSTIKHTLGATAAPFKRTQWSYPAVLNRHKEYTVFHTMSFPAFSSPASSTKCFITVVLFCILLPMSVISM